MSLQRAPWWMYAVAASFLAYFALVDYTLWSGPELVGMGVDYGQRGAFLSDIGPGSPAERAGLQRGDRVVAVNGLVVHGALEWNMVGTNCLAGP
jgi:predicted metalloprotease with PDZ domain